MIVVDRLGNIINNGEKQNNFLKKLMVHLLEDVF